MTDKEIRIENTERFSEMHKVAVKPFGRGSHMIFPKKHLGKIVTVLIPLEEKSIWLLSDKDLESLKEIKIEVKDNKTHWAITENLFQECVEEISKSPKEFDTDYLVWLTQTLEQYDPANKLLKKIKAVYGI